MTVAGIIPQAQPDASQTQPPAVTPETTQPAPEPATPSAPEPAGKTFTQEEVNRMLADDRRKNEEKANREKESARIKAEEDAAVKNEEWKALAESRGKTIADLEPKAAKAERYETTINTYLTEERKIVPEHFLTVLDKLDPDEQLQWIVENREKLTTPATPERTGVPPSPNATPTPPSTMEAEVEAEKKRLKQEGGYYG